MKKEHIILGCMILLGVLTILFGSLYGVEARKNVQLTEINIQLSGDKASFLKLSTALLDFHKTTREYVGCLWGAMNQDNTWTSCDSDYRTYKEMRNILADNELVDTRIIDR